MRRAAIVSPLRTPVGKFLGSLKDIAAGDLAAIVIKGLIERTGIDPARIDDVVFAQGYANGEAPCIARWAALAAGLPVSVPGYQLDRRCGSGLQAIIDAAMLVQTGAADVVIAGGVESMSNVEYYSTDMRRRRPRRLSYAARPTDSWARDVAADGQVRRHQRHDRDGGKSREGLWDRPGGL